MKELGKFYNQEKLDCVKVLLNACALAQSKGVYSFSDSASIHAAIQKLMSAPDHEVEREVEAPPVGSE